VEIANQPGDPDNLSRDDLVFKDGSLHIVSENLSVTFDLDPTSCRFRLDVQQFHDRRRWHWTFGRCHGPIQRHRRSERDHPTSPGRLLQHRQYATVAGA
jgi:hypothetical protein